MPRPTKDSQSHEQEEARSDIDTPRVDELDEDTRARSRRDDDDDLDDDDEDVDDDDVVEEIDLDDLSAMEGPDA